MKNRLGDKVRLNHLLDAISEIESYIKDIDKTKFFDNSMMKFATVKQLEIIGEAANHLSDELKNKHKDIEWNRIIGLRNILVHQYFGIDDEVVWQIVQDDLPEFKEQIVEIIKSI